MKVKELIANLLRLKETGRRMNNRQFRQLLVFLKALLPPESLVPPSEKVFEKILKVRSNTIILTQLGLLPS